MSETRPTPGSRRASRRPAILGRYRLLKKIGMGGMAEIWVAAVTGMSGVRKICVVKQILPQLADSPEFVRMFLDEARIAATLDHPNLVQMYDVEEVDGVPVIAMEYLHGEDLRTIKKLLKSADRRMPLEHAISIAVGVAAGLHYAHEKVGFDGKPLNIVHRDVSPHNVFVTYDGAVKILDFGIAKATNRIDETRDGALKGKVRYMSPEQCRSERLDRRSDIYAAGILLYEMSTGSGIIRRGATEFELMRAIIEDPIKPPSEIAVDYPPALERIVLRCLAREREARYASARDLQADLEAFAREHRLATSTLGLSSFMSEVVGQRVEAWRGALASGIDLPAQLVELNDPGDQAHGDAGSGGRTGHGPVPSRSAVEREPFATKRSAAFFSSSELPAMARVGATAPEAVPPPADAGAPHALTVTRRRLGDLLIVSLSGRMTEEFQGAALARGISGRVLFDLAGVQRVTSFGVREWLSMLTEVAQHVSGLYFGRCSEPIVNQMGMIRRFVGEGHIVSFYGPYRCDRCGNTFARLFECERDAQAIRTAEPPPSPCARCGAPAVFDDDAAVYFSFASRYLGAVVPADVRAAVDEMAKLDAGGTIESIEKTVDERGTWLCVRCKIDESVRWKRALDGIEGDLVLDLTESTGVSAEGLVGFEQAVRSLGEEVKTIRIEGCPRPLLEHLAAARPELRALVSTVLVEGACERCRVPRQALLDVEAGVASALGDREPYVSCKRCNAPLSFAPLKPLLRRIGGAPVPPREDAPAALLDGKATPPRAPALAAVLLGCAVAGVGFAYWSSCGAPSGTAPAVSAAPPEGRAAAPALENSPPWASDPFTAEGEHLFAVGRGSAATKESALALARTDAIVQVVEQLLPALAGSETYGFIRSRSGGERSPEAAEAQASRYLRQVGAFATPERVEARFHEGGEVMVIARYRMRKHDFDAAAQTYRRTVSVLGMTVASLFPQLSDDIQTSGDIVVIALDGSGLAATAGVRAGDALVAMNGRALSTPDALRRSLKAATDSGSVQLEIEAGGARRTVIIDLAGDSR